MKSDYDQLKALSEEYGQRHVFRFWKELNSEARSSLLYQLQRIDFKLMDLLARQKVHELEIDSLELVEEGGPRLGIQLFPEPEDMPLTVFFRESFELVVIAFHILDLKASGDPWFYAKDQSLSISEASCPWRSQGIS